MRYGQSGDMAVPADCTNAASYDRNVAVSAGCTNIGNRVHQTIVTPVTPVMSPLSPRRTHMAVSACCNDGTEENASNTCGLAVSACCLQLSNTWLCQPVAQTWLCQPAVSMLHVAEQTHVGWLFQPAAPIT